PSTPAPYPLPLHDALPTSAVPHARLIADANEAWQPHEVESLLATAAAVGVELVEQPLPAGNDELLAHVERLVPVSRHAQGAHRRSEEHTSELQSLTNLVCR